MRPQKEGKYLLRHLIDMWGYYTDGWTFSCTWRGEGDEWQFVALHLEHCLTGVTGFVSRASWESRHLAAVDDLAEAMYLRSFEREPREAVRV